MRTKSLKTGGASTATTLSPDTSHRISIRANTATTLSPDTSHRISIRTSTATTLSPDTSHRLRIRFTIPTPKTAPNYRQIRDHQTITGYVTHRQIIITLPLSHVSQPNHRIINRNTSLTYQRMHKSPENTTH